MSNSIVYRVISDPSINELEENIFVCEGGDRTDNLLIHKNAKRKCDPRLLKNKIVIRYDLKLILRNAISLRKRVVLQKLNPIY